MGTPYGATLYYSYTTGIYPNIFAKKMWVTFFQQIYCEFYIELHKH